MPLFEKFSRVPDSRSNTKLVVSGHASPAETWIVDPELPVLFTYPYGGPGQTDVVIAKGMAVAIKGFGVDSRTRKQTVVLTIADGTNPVIGIAPYNFCQRVDDRFTGNDPAIITQDYIELPYIPDPNDAALVKWGAVYGDVQPGDFVKPGTGANKGKLTKWNPATDSVTQIVGQVLGADLNQEPFGWLRWVMWDETARQEDLNPTLPAPGPEGYPYDPSYKDGVIGTSYWTKYTAEGKGIPGLTDGSQMSAKVFSKTLTIPAGTTAGTKILLDLGYKNIVKGSVAVLDGATAVDTSTYTVDLKSGLLTFTVPAAYAGAGTDKTLTVNFRAYFYGVLPGWDYTGSVGAYRILLKL